MTDIWNIRILYISALVMAVAKLVARYTYVLVIVQMVSWDN